MTPGEPREPSEGLPEFKIETIRTPDGSEVSFCPARGGIITSLKLRGTEVLYMERETFLDPKTNVKGGIPILFPNAGPVDSPEYPRLTQHGFARSSSGWKLEQRGDGPGFSETLASDEETQDAYPYHFQLAVRGAFEDDGSFMLRQEVTNAELAKEMPISMGLHPYFRVPHDEKRNIRFNFIGGDALEKDVDKWANGKACSVDNPAVKNSGEVLRVEVPSLGTLVIDASPEYKKIWVWSLTDKDFVCVEPVMRDKGGLVQDPENVPPGKTFSARFNIRLES